MSEQNLIPESPGNGGVSKKTWVLAGGLIALIVIVILTFLYFQNKEAINDLLTIKEQMEVEITDLEQELSTMESAIMDKDVEMDKKDAIIQEKSEEVEKLKKQIFKLVAAGKLSEEKAMEQQGKIDQLTYYIRKYQNEISNLKAENEELKYKVASIEGERDSIKTKYSQAKDQNTIYQVKIEGAAILSATEFSFIPVKRNGKEQDSDSEFKANKIEKLKICARISENSLTKKGMKDFYLVIKNPDGSVQSGGTFELNKKQTVYTLKTGLDYQGKSTRLCYDWTAPSNLSKGQYQVMIFTDGYEAGSGTFTLR